MLESVTVMKDDHIQINDNSNLAHGPAASKIKRMHGILQLRKQVMKDRVLNLHTVTQYNSFQTRPIGQEWRPKQAC